MKRVQKVLAIVGFMAVVILAIWSTQPFAETKAQSDANNSPIEVWIDPAVPIEFPIMLAPLFSSGKYLWANTPDNARLEVSINAEGGAISSDWVYVPVVPFASTAETITYADIEHFWTTGDAAPLAYISSDRVTAPRLVVTGAVYDALRTAWGEPNSAATIELVTGDTPEISGKLWEERPNAWSIVPFHLLSPDLKVLKLDGVNIFADDFQLTSYPLKVRVALTGHEAAVGQAIDDLMAAQTWQPTNRDITKMTRIVLTGVTAMSRATAYKMETLGVTKPGELILPFVQDANILHTSNEVAFSENCPTPDPYIDSTVFCAADKYMELLTYIGLDVVELTGNHVNDYGVGALRHSLDLYDANGIAHFGGGRNFEDARLPYLVENNGNTIAFIGCNVPGPFKSWATTEDPGSSQCDEAYLAEELPKLAAENDIVIMSVQQWEFYRYEAGLEQIGQFTNFANLGADVVIGTQAHQPQGFTFVTRPGQPPSFLHHGLGNLFFDQMQSIGTRQMFMDKLIIYDGRLISVDLFTGMLEDYCCPRPMTADERVDFLTTIFAASGW
ncbi:MAG: CapA family protein [Chloroflexi bacterium]|nr:CapA family protein [Chloroflexota bacterium]